MVLPGCRRRNATKVAIRNFKSHFLSVLTGTAESFPVHLWDRLERYTDSFSIRTLIWTIRLQQNVISPTQAERLTDTIQFKHKNITNPTISPHDKIMHALANCKMAIKGMMNENPNQQMGELQTIFNNAQAHLNQRKEINLQQVPRVESQQVSRVDTYEPNQAPLRPSDNHTPTRITDTPTAR